MKIVQSLSMLFFFLVASFLSNYFAEQRICGESVKYKSAFLPSCEEVYKKYDPRYKE